MHYNAWIELEEEHLLYLACGVFLLLLAIRKFKPKHIRLISGNSCGVILILLGGYNYDKSENHEQVEFHSSQLDSLHAFEGTIISYPEIKTSHTTQQILLHQGIKDSTIVDLDIVIQLYIKSDSTIEVQYGDQVRFAAKVTPIQNPRNPHVFDYSKFMAEQNIHFQSFTTSSALSITSHHQANPILAAIFGLRSQFQKTINTHIPSDDERGIALALLLGIKSGLDPEIKASYAATGAMHVLAVSGLHVGIIYLIISSLLKLIPSYTFTKYAVPILSIIALWSYALLTGFSPSILRAVAMLTVIIMGQSLNRKANTYNSLAIAALALLLFNPVLLFSVGFQLSFLAVIGIVFIYPRLYKILQFNNALISKIWSLTCVSIAAQIATFPLSIYYFNQFPNYFLLSNLIVIPAAFAIMILGISLVILGHFEFAKHIGWLIQKITYIMNHGIQYIQNMEGSVSEWIYLSLFQTFILYTLISSVVLYFIFNKMKFIYLAITLTAMVVLDRVITLTQQANIKKLTFYSTKKAHYMDNIRGLKAELYSLDSIQNDQLIKYQIGSNRLHSNLPKPEKALYIRRDTTALSDFGHLSIQNGHRVLYLFKPITNGKIKFKISCDLLVISNQSVTSLSKLIEVIGFDQIILDSTNGSKYVERIKIEGDKLNLKISDNQSFALNIY